MHDDLYIVHTSTTREGCRAMNDYELDDFKNDRFGEFERFINENYDGMYTSIQMIEMFTEKSSSDPVFYDYSDDIPF